MFAEKKFNNNSYFYEKLLNDYWKAKILRKKLSIKRLSNYKMLKTYLFNNKS